MERKDRLCLSIEFHNEPLRWSRAVTTVITFLLICFHAHVKFTSFGLFASSCSSKSLKKTFSWKGFTKTRKFLSLSRQTVSQKSLFSKDVCILTTKDARKEEPSTPPPAHTVFAVCPPHQCNFNQLQSCTRSPSFTTTALTAALKVGGVQGVLLIKVCVYLNPLLFPAG